MEMFQTILDLNFKLEEHCITETVVIRNSQIRKRLNDEMAAFRKFINSEKDPGWSTVRGPGPDILVTDDDVPV